MSEIRSGHKFQVNPLVKATKVTAFGYRFEPGVVYDSGELRMPEEKFTVLMKLKMGTVPFFLPANEEALPPENKEV